MSDDDIKITAQPLNDPDVCIFTVDRPIYPNATFDCRNAGQAKGSPLLEALFELGSIREILVSGNSLTIAKSGDEPWQLLGKKIGEVLRKRIKSGIPLIVISQKKVDLDPDSVRHEIEDLFENQINPAIASHGGFVELVDVKGSAVYLRMSGGCQGCGAASMTLRHGIEKAIRERIPEVTEVVDVTDHTAGVNPYY